MKIRKRDGTMVEVDDDYILQDGESYRVALSLMDSSKRGMIVDARGQCAGTRPGFLINDDARAEQAVRDAYKEYDATLGERWRKGPGQPSAESKPPTAPQVFDSPQDAVAASYRQYDKDISERWRRQW